MSEVSDNLADSAVEYQISLLRVEAGMRKKVVAKLEDLEVELLAVLAKNKGLAPGKKQLIEDTLAAMRATTNAAYEEINALGEKDLESVAQLTTKKTTTDLRSQIGGVAVGPMKLSASQLTEIVRGPIIEGNPIQAWWQGQSEGTQRKLVGAVQQGMILGEGVDDIARRIRGTKAANFEDGILSVSRREAQAITRTAVQSVANEAKIKALLESSDVVKGIEWVSTLDSRTTPTCRALDGLQWTLPGFEPVKHDKKFPGSIAHWGCRSTQIAVTRSWSELAGKPVPWPDKATFDEAFAANLEAQGFTPEQIATAQANQRASMDGSTSSGLDFDAWARKKGDDYIRSLLGPGRFALWKDNKLKMRDLVDQAGRELTIAQLEAAIEAGGLPLETEGVEFSVYTKPEPEPAPGAPVLWNLGDFTDDDAWPTAAPQNAVQQLAITHYSGTGAVDINHALRNKTDLLDVHLSAPKIKAMNGATAVEALDLYFASAPATTADRIVRRGMNIDDTTAAQLFKPGADITEAGYWSTTKDVTEPLNAKWNVVIQVPAGSKGVADIENYAQAKAEREVLFDRDSTYKVLSYDPATKTAVLQFVPKGTTIAPVPAPAPIESAPKFTATQIGSLAKGGTQKDFKARQKVFDEFEAGPYSDESAAAEMIKQALFEEGDTFVLRDENGDIIAAITWADDDGGELEIRSVGSVKAGGGKQAIELAIKAAQANDSDIVLLSVPNAIGFYEKLGFTKGKEYPTGTLFSADGPTQAKILSNLAAASDQAPGTQVNHAEAAATIADTIANPKGKTLLAKALTTLQKTEPGLTPTDMLAKAQGIAQEKQAAASKAAALSQAKKKILEGGIPTPAQQAVIDSLTPEEAANWTTSIDDAKAAQTAPILESLLAKINAVDMDGPTMPKLDAAPEWTQLTGEAKAEAEKTLFYKQAEWAEKTKNALLDQLAEAYDLGEKIGLTIEDNAKLAQLPNVYQDQVVAALIETGAKQDVDAIAYGVMKKGHTPEKAIKEIEAIGAKHLPEYAQAAVDDIKNWVAANSGKAELEAMAKQPGIAGTVAKSYLDAKAQGNTTEPWANILSEAQGIVATKAKWALDAAVIQGKGVTKLKQAAFKTLTGIDPAKEPLKATEHFTALDAPGEALTLLEKVEAIAAEKQAAASLASKLSTAKAKIVAGKAPSPSEQAAIDSLDPAAKAAWKIQVDEAKALATANEPGLKIVPEPKKLDTKKGLAALAKQTKIEDSEFMDYWFLDEDPTDDDLATPIKFVDGGDPDAEASQMFSVKTDEEKAKTANAVLELSPADILTYQPQVSKATIEAYIKSGDLATTNPAHLGKMPWAVKVNGKYFLQDGNHRVSAWILSGETKIPVLVYDLDNPDPKKPVPPDAVKAANDANMGTPAPGAYKVTTTDKVDEATFTKMKNDIQVNLGLVPEKFLTKATENPNLSPGQKQILKAIQDAKHSKVSIAYDDQGKIVAAISYSKTKSGETVVLRNVGSIGKNGGTQLVKEAVDYAISENKPLFIESLEGAVDYYEKWGFQKVEGYNEYETDVATLKKISAKMEAYLGAGKPAPAPAPAAPTALQTVTVVGSQKSKAALLKAHNATKDTTSMGDQIKKALSSTSATVKTIVPPGKNEAPQAAISYVALGGSEIIEIQNVGAKGGDIAQMAALLKSAAEEAQAKGYSITFTTSDPVVKAAISADLKMPQLGSVNPNGSSDYGMLSGEVSDFISTLDEIIANATGQPVATTQAPNATKASTTQAPPKPVKTTTPTDRKNEPKRPAVTVTIKVPEPANLKIIERLGGSTGAQLATDSSGKKWVVKKGASPEHVRAEHQADEIYRALGFDVPAGAIFETKDGPVKVTEFLEGAKTLGNLSGAQRAEANRKLQDGLAVDAVLGNWDVIGMGADNVMVAPDGRVFRIDNGGSMEFRAQGGIKQGNEWNDYPTEIFSMRNATQNSSAAGSFGDLNIYDLARAIERVDWSRLENLELPATTKATIINRAAEARRLANRARQLERDAWTPDYAERHLKESLEMREGGVVTDVPRKLTVQSTYDIRDEKGALFGGLRASGGSGTVTAKPKIAGDYFADKIEAAFKSIVHKANNGSDITEGTALTKASAALSLKADLEALAKNKKASADQKEMAKKYLQDLKWIQKQVDKGGVPEALNASQFFAPYKPPTTATPAPAAVQDARSVVQRWEARMASKGIPTGPITSWLEEQSRNSWKPEAQAAKYAFSLGMEDPKSRQYWGGNGTYKTDYEKCKAEFKKVAKAVGGEEKAIELFTSYHAMVQEVLNTFEDVPWIDKDRKAILLYRTVSNEELQGSSVPNSNPGGPYVPKVGEFTPLRGVTESHSIYTKTFIYGNNVTVQAVPFTRVYGIYWLEQYGGSGGSSFLGDGEAEVAANTSGIPAIYDPTYKEPSQADSKDATNWNVPIQHLLNP